MVDLTRLGIEGLEAQYRRNRGNRKECLRILEELDRRRENRMARGDPLYPQNEELAATIRSHLGIVGAVPQECVAATVSEPKPWYRRGGIILSGASLVIVGVVQGISHAVGFHMWEPIWRKVQELSALW